MGDERRIYDFRKPAATCEGAREAYALQRSVFFVGFMGAGKTSVVRKLARRAGVAAIDMDSFIVRQSDMSVPEIFEHMGEDGFRTIETSVLRDLALGEPRLVSCGGGVVLREENRAILRDHGFVVYLKVTAAEAASRISDLSSRPLFGDLEQAQRVIDGRLALYEEVADISIDTVGRGSGAVARDAFHLLKKRGILWRQG